MGTIQYSYSRTMARGYSSRSHRLLYNQLQLRLLEMRAYVQQHGNSDSHKSLARIITRLIRNIRFLYDNADNRPPNGGRLVQFAGVGSSRNPKSEVRRCLDELLRTASQYMETEERDAFCAYDSGLDLATQMEVHPDFSIWHMGHIEGTELDDRWIRHETNLAILEDNIRNYHKLDRMIRRL